MGYSVNAMLYILLYKQKKIRYVYQLFFNAPHQIIINAALNHQLDGIIFLNNPKLIEKYLAPSPSAPKMKQPRPN